LETFNVSLAVSDEFGCVDSISHGVQRYPCIFVNFVTDTSIYCERQTIIFKDSSIVDETASIISRSWNFGDGYEINTGAEVEMVTHAYETSDVEQGYTITYVVSFDVDGD
ncbi:PKD domain-containing protein, partial [Lentimicrobium sp. S6]|uniref:PKD domain-containing protein n=1 Tax=Lentimicrobium sp. S6 TaxID=2735872 RepID=UPI0015518C58